MINPLAWKKRRWWSRICVQKLSSVFVQKSDQSWNAKLKQNALDLNAHYSSIILNSFDILYNIRIGEIMHFELVQGFFVNYLKIFCIFFPFRRRRFSIRFPLPRTFTDSGL